MTATFSRSIFPGGYSLHGVQPRPRTPDGADTRSLHHGQPTSCTYLITPNSPMATGCCAVNKNSKTDSEEPTDGKSSYHPRGPPPRELDGLQDWGHHRLYAAAAAFPRLVNDVVRVCRIWAVLPASSSLQSWRRSCRMAIRCSSMRRSRSAPGGVRAQNLGSTVFRILRPN